MEELAGPHVKHDPRCIAKDVPWRSLYTNVDVPHREHGVICLDQDVKTHKGLGIRVIDVENFCNEKSLYFTLYGQAYHNFLKCMEACILPGYMLPQA